MTTSPAAHARSRRPTPVGVDGRGVRSLRLRRLASLALVAMTLVAASGCGGPTNPSFALTTAEARGVLRQMRNQPVELERPVLVLAGFLDPGFASDGIATEIRRTTTGGPVIPVTFLGTNSFEQCRARVRRSLRIAYPELAATGGRLEVDVVGVSMGGLVARSLVAEASPTTTGPLDVAPELVVRRIFTIATPHRGAKLAGLPTLDGRVADMRAGSTFLATLDAARADGTDRPVHGPAPDDGPEIVTYARLGDIIVGEERTSLPGEVPIWVPTPPFALSHLQAAGDPRILADILRRLRGEPPLADEERAPLPR